MAKMPILPQIIVTNKDINNDDDDIYSSDNNNGLFNISTLWVFIVELQVKVE